MLSQLKRPRNNDTPIAMNTPRVCHKLVSNTILQEKEPGLLGEMSDARAGAGHIEQVSCSTRKSGSAQKNKLTEVCKRDTEASLKELPMAGRI